MKAGTHSAFGERSHTRAHTAKQGHSLPRPQCGFALPVNSFLFRHAFIYIHFPVLCDPHYIKSGRVAATNAVSQPFLIAVSTSLTNGPRLLSQAKVGTHSAFRERSHTRAHTAKQGAFRAGWYHYPRHVLHIHEHPRAGCQDGKLCRFWGSVRCAPEERRKPSGQRCAYARRCPEGVAALLGCVIFLLLSKW